MKVRKVIMILNIAKYIFCVLFLVTILLSPTIAIDDLASQNSEDRLENILAHVSRADNSALAKDYCNEIRGLYAKKNEPVDPSIQYVFVLSGRSSYLKKPVDGPDVKDLEDDYNRIELAIETAKGVVRTCLNKSEITQEEVQQYGPTIIYNGRREHNKDLEKALNDGTLSHYPKDKFRILEIGEASTRGQFISLKQDLPLSHTSVAIITHAYHFPRVGRMIGSKWHPFGDETKVFFYLVDRDFKAPGSCEDIMGEVGRISRYIDNGDLNISISPEINF